MEPQELIQAITAAGFTAVATFDTTKPHGKRKFSQCVGMVYHVADQAYAPLKVASKLPEVSPEKLERLVAIFDNAQNFHTGQKCIFVFTDVQFTGPVERTIIEAIGV